MYQITFKISGSGDRKVPAVPKQSLLDAARNACVSIDAPCGGVGSCGKCRVRLLEGVLDSEKNRHISDEEYAAGWRLACVSRVISDAVIEIPAAATAYQDSLSSDFTAKKRDFSSFSDLQKKLAEEGIGFPKTFRTVVFKLPTPSLSDT